MLKKILIIEDEPFIAEMYKMKFLNEGYDVAIATDGEEGLDMAMSSLPDMILLDIVMPKLNGYQVLQALKEHELTRKIKVFVLSNLGQNGEIEQGMAAGADGYFVKANLTPSQLLANIKKIFAGELTGQQLMRKLPKPESEKKAAEPKGISLLLIEDQEPIIEMYRLRLENDGYSVTVARNGVWGLSQAREKEFSAIIMDIMMPEMNGLDVLKELKRESQNKNAPIIVLSNSAQDGDIKKALDAGADCFLLKAKITPAKLIEEIEKLLKSDF